MPLRRRHLATALLPAVLVACATTGDPRCAAGQQPAVQDVLYFGTQTPSGRVSAEEWARFLGEVVTPKFPDGLTVWEASGQWRSASGDIVREPSYVLTLVHPAGADHASAVREVAEAYATRFRQEAVLRVTTPACIAF